MGTGMKDPPDSIEDMKEDHVMWGLASQSLDTRDTEIGNNADGLKGDHNTHKHDDGGQIWTPTTSPALREHHRISLLSA
jgi:hypothetical protein